MSPNASHRNEGEPMSADTLRSVRHWLAHILFHHLPEEPYPSDHPASLRRAPREVRG